MLNDPDKDLVLAGMGSGISLLDGSTTPLSLYDPNPSFGGIDNELRPLGFVRDVDLTDDHLYVAAGIAGLVRYDRNDDLTGEEVFAEQWKFIDPMAAVANAPEAWVVAAHRIEPFDYIFVGTHNYGDIGTGCPSACDEDGTGTLFILKAEPGDATPPSIAASIDLGAPIYAIDSMLVDDTLTVLVGTACKGGASQPESLLRYEWDVSEAGPATFTGAQKGTWSVANSPTFIEDIVIDEDGDGNLPMAYVAASSQGLHKLQLDTDSTLTEITTGGFPITTGTPSGPDLFKAVDIQHAAGSDILVVGTGPALRLRRQVYGCADATACDEPGGLSERYELRLYDAVSGGCLKVLRSAADRCTSSTEACASLLIHKTQVMDVDARPDPGNDPDSFLIDLAGDIQDFQMVEASFDGGAGGWDLARIGSWGKDHPGLPAGSFDDVLQLGNTLYVGLESGVAAFNVTPNPSDPQWVDNLLRETAVDYTNGSAVFLKGFVDPNDPGRHVLLGRGNDNINFFNATTHWSVAGSITSDGRIQPGVGKFWRGYGIDVIEDGTPDGQPWLITANRTDNSGQKQCTAMPPDTLNGGVHIYRLRDGFGAHGGNGIWTAAEAEELGSWQESTCDANGDPIDNVDFDGGFVGVKALPTGDPDVLAILVNYGPQDLETGAGVMVLKATYSEASNPDGEVVITWESKVEAVSGACDEAVGTINYPIGPQALLGCALGCNGIALYDVTDPLNPGTPLVWSPNTGCDAGGLSALHIIDGPGNKAYASLINMDVGGIGQLDLISMTMDSIQPTPFNTNGILMLDEMPPSGGPQLFVSDGRGGVHVIQYDSMP